MKKYYLLAILFGFGLTNAYAGGVTDDNNGNQGYILVSTGENNGANSVGHWTDPSFLKGEKGDKGDTGATGATGAKGDKGDKGDTGAQGIQGVAGQNGTNGVDGKDGKDGKDGINGINGLNGEKGDKGDKGDTGATGEQGIKGDTGEHGKDVDPETVNNINNSINNTNNAVASTNNRIDDLNNRVGRLERPQAIIGGVLRIQDSRKWQTNLFIDYSATRNAVAMYGIRFTYKMGKSYEERRLDELEAKLDKANRVNEQLEKEANTQYYATPNGIGVRTRF